ncbi:biotin-dependent carboxyltransferase family protein [Paracoccus sp. TK19116]|uniref:Biotin-dependent carboxyltransferase family protein n=1 Tax=Paracoccus albicereus TaxID=2922394 RepID=A0ABT1MMW2_9RHOB|nr:biotin-dependent carboxyltransferase family protein [Paracoccus albicereus]MCQ0969623.1 biotin-dependent carboxyltransferase family protein [Paracoccus albicereus]
MADAVLQIGHAGPHASWQDAGRPGRMRFGVPASGPMDRIAYAAANRALGNPDGQPAIEISLGGLRLVCLSGEIGIAVAGGGFVVETGEIVTGSWSVLNLAAGETLSIRPGPWGCWTYLGFAGRPDVAHWLGSAATHALSGLGGGALQPGQTLTIADAAPGPAAARRIPCPVWARPQDELHVVIGPQDRFFPPEAIEALSAQAFALTDAYDRMGVRLSGPLLTPLNSLSIPSEPVLRGSVQVSGDGVATVLLADHQTTGGYPKIATIIDADLDGFVQLRPHDPVAFRKVTADRALQIARQRAQIHQDWLNGLGRG